MKKGGGFTVSMVGIIFQDGKKFPIHCLFVANRDDLEDELEVHLEEFLLSARESGFLPFPNLLNDKSVRADLELLGTLKGYWVITETEEAQGFGDHVGIQYIEYYLDEVEIGPWEIKPTESKMQFGKKDGLLLVGSPLSES